jgi:hypothetical protein
MMKWLLLFGLTLGVLMMPNQVIAKEKKTYALSMKIFKQIEKANLLVEEGNFLEALNELDEL